MNYTPRRSVVGKILYEAWHGKKPSLKHLRVFGCLAPVHVLNDKQKKLDYRATPGIFIGSSIWTKQYIIYHPLPKMLHRSRDVVFRAGNWYSAANAADEAILNEHFCRDLIEEPIPKPTPIEKQSTERQMEESLDDNPPPDPQKPKTKKSRQLAGFETSLGDAWTPLGEGSHQNRCGKNRLAESAQLALEGEECEDMIPIYAAAAISDDHEDGLDDQKSYKAATESPLAEKWDTAMKEELDAIVQHQVFGDFVELPERRKALPSHWVYKMKRDGAGNVQRFKARLVCGVNHQIEGIDYQATYSQIARLGHIRLALAIAAKYDLQIHQMDVCTGFMGVDLEEKIYMHPPQGYFCMVQTGSRYYDPRSKTSQKMVLRM